VDFLDDLSDVVDRMELMIRCGLLPFSRASGVVVLLGVSDVFLCDQDESPGDEEVPMILILAMAKWCGAGLWFVC